ncbi:MAG TPA: flavin reductase [Ruminococcaceae bacterium]|nr:flavin reductase [Oscillospiraceae bacterium]
MNMNKFIELDPLELRGNVFQQIGRDWTLISAGHKGNFNTMTASWGGMGVLWNVNVCFAFVRPSRYTYEFIEREKYFSLSFFGDGYRRALQFCGAHSGRDTDKMAGTGLTPIFDTQAPYYDECHASLICRKMYFQDINHANFLDPTIKAHYKKDDYHRMYVGEIIKVLKGER